METNRGKTSDLKLLPWILFSKSLSVSGDQAHKINQEPVVRVQIWIVLGCWRDCGASDVALLCQGWFGLWWKKRWVCVTFWGVRVCVHGMHKCPLPWCCCTGGVARYPPWAAGSQVWVPGGPVGSVHSCHRAEMQGSFVPLSPAGVPGDSCSTLSIIKRKLWANPCATTWLGKQRAKIPVPALSWWGGAQASLSSLRFIIFQQNFLSHLSVFLQLKQFLLPNFQHLEFSFSLLKKKKKNS